MMVSVLGLAKRGKNNHIIAVLWVGTQPNNFWDKISCSVLTEILTLLLMLVFDLSLGLERSKICHDCLINVQCIDNKNCTKCHHESSSHPSRDYKQQPTLKILLILIFNQPRTMTGQSHKYNFSCLPAVLCEKPIEPPGQDMKLNLLSNKITFPMSVIINCWVYVLMCYVWVCVRVYLRDCSIIARIL